MLVRRETLPVSDDEHLTAANKPAAGRGAGAALLEALLSKQQVEFPRALVELEEHGRKMTHRICSVFPTELCGASEPPPATSVTTTTARSLLRRAPRSWRECLGKVCALVKPWERSPGTDALAKVDSPPAATGLRTPMGAFTWTSRSFTGAGFTRPGLVRLPSLFPGPCAHTHGVQRSEQRKHLQEMSYSARARRRSGLGIPAAMYEKQSSSPTAMSRRART